MYFTLSKVKNDRAAQLAVITANELGERMLAGEDTHVAFEAAVTMISGKTNNDAQMVAAKLLNEDLAYRKNAIRIGMQEIVRSLGGEDNTLAYFRQVTEPKYKFDSVGGIKDDLMSAKNRSAALAMQALDERARNPNFKGHTTAEREFIDFTKSVKRTLNDAAENKTIHIDTARSMQLMVEEAAYVDQRTAQKTHIIGLQAEAGLELYQEVRTAVMAKYRPIKTAEKKVDSTPSTNMH